MFRFNNPDALLVLLLVAGRVRRAAGGRDGAARGGWCWPASLVGFGFLDQDAAGVPGRAGVRAGLPGRGADRRCGGGVLQLLARRAGRWWSSAGWWVAVVELVPASSRPYIGGSQNNSSWS